MKVTCESCGSKYTIKDDKVRGKRVKIRCKGCKSPIVVDGLSIDGSSASSDSENAPAYSDVPEAPDDTGLASAQAAFPAAAPGGAGVERWSVNLSETDSRDMTTNEIVAAWQSGLVTDDAYIYKPGFDDWKPILEVPELARLLTNSGAADAFSPPGGKSPFAAHSAAPRAAVSGRRGDLFGGVAEAGGEDDAGTPAAPMVLPGMDGKPTGARNESSVLFSLDALKAGFAAPSTAPAAPTRNDDPFGLTAAPSLSLGGGFDQNAALFAPPPPEPKKPKKSSLPPAPGAPAPAASLDRSKLIMIAVGALALLIAVGGVGFALGGSDSDKSESAEQAGLEKEAPAKAREGAEDKAAEKKAAEEKAAAEAKKAEEAAEKKDEKAEAEKPAEESAKADAEKPAEAAAATTKAAAATTTATKSDTATKSTKTEAPKTDSGAPPFNKSAAISALGSAAANAAGCKVPGGPTGSGKAIVTFAPSGRVTSANVSGGKFGGTSVGGCVASRFRGARVPPFSGSPVTVSKSFTVP